LNTKKKSEFENILQKLEIIGGISFFYASDERYLIVTELKILCTNTNFDIIWTHGYHQDMIWNAIIINDTVQITEFENSSSYKLDLKTGKEIAP